MSMPSSDREALLRLAALGALGPARTLIQDREVSGWLATSSAPIRLSAASDSTNCCPSSSDLAGELPRERFRVQTLNRLRSHGIATWTQLTAISPKELERWNQCGPVTAKNIAEAALSAWSRHDPAAQPAATPTNLPPQENLQAQADEQVDSPSSKRAAGPQSDTTSSSYSPGSGPNAESIARRDRPERGAADAPDPVQEAWQRVTHTSIAELLGQTEATEPAWQAVLNFEPRRLLILRRRVLPHPDKTTLTQLGRELDLTRERVRQIQRDLTQTLSERLNNTPGIRIRHLAARLTKNTPADPHRRHALITATVATTSDTPSTPDAQLRHALLAHLTHPHPERTHSLITLPTHLQNGVSPVRRTVVSIVLS